MVDVDEIARLAEVIIAGFAVLSDGSNYKVVNLNNAHGVAVLRADGSLIETNMDPIELSIARRNLRDALAYMED